MLGGAAGNDGCDAGMGIVGNDEGGPTGAQVSIPVRIDPSLAHIPLMHGRCCVTFSSCEKVGGADVRTHEYGCGFINWMIFGLTSDL